jgi:hypothetical protein
MTVWCMRTWLRTLPSAYLASSCVAASSTASEMAIPREPGVSGSWASIARPARVSAEGDASTFAPQSCMRLLRYGFCVNDTFTM